MYITSVWTIKLQCYSFSSLLSVLKNTEVQRFNQAKVNRRRRVEEIQQKQEQEEKEGRKMGKRERQERKDAERQRRTERRRRRRREEAERKEREEIERLKRDRRGRADKIKKRKKERKGQDQEERVRERKNDAEKPRTTEGNEMLPCPRLPTDLLCLGTPEVKDIRIWMEQAKRMKLLLEKQAVEQKIRHEREKKERKGQGGNEKEEENQRREVAKKKSFVSSLKTRYLEHKREQIINSLFRTCQQEDAINAGGRICSFFTYEVHTNTSCFTSTNADTRPPSRWCSWSKGDKKTETSGSQKDADKQTRRDRGQNQSQEGQREKDENSRGGRQRRWEERVYFLQSGYCVVRPFCKLKYNFWLHLCGSRGLFFIEDLK